MPQAVERFGFRDWLAAQTRLADALPAVDEFVAVAAAVAEEVAVDGVVVAVHDAAHGAVALTGGRVAAEAAMHADGGRHLQVPFARVVALEGGVGEDAGGADLDEVAGELAFEHAIALAAEEDGVAQTEGAEVRAAGVVAIEALAAVALDAAVHFVVDEGAQVLIAEGALFEGVAAVVVAGHHGHVLEMALAAFVADRAVVRVVEHEAFDDAFAEFHGFWIVDRDARAVADRGHAGHDELALVVRLILELLDGALPARADRAERGVPAKVRQVEAGFEAGGEEIVLVAHREQPVIDVDGGHLRSLPDARCRARGSGVRECGARNRRGSI